MKAPRPYRPLQLYAALVFTTSTHKFLEYTTETGQHPWRCRPRHTLTF